MNEDVLKRGGLGEASAQGDPPGPATMGGSQLTLIEILPRILVYRHT